jgi:CDP-4-dehydro-6-deoxyglucose reductase
MNALRFAGQPVAMEEGETVLDALLRAGVEHPWSCRSGACQSCLVKAVRGTVPAAAQQGLSATLRATGHFLACVAPAASDLELEPPGGEGAEYATTVLETRRLGSDVLALRLALPEGFAARAGQYVSLVRDPGIVRSYSLAGIPEIDDGLELHVRRVEGGVMSRYLFEQLAVGDRLALRGPAGQCFYVPGRAAQPLLLAGTGTGLAPLLGILRDALRCGHEGTITLLHGARDVAGLYARDTLAQIAAEHPNVELILAALDVGSAPPHEVVQGALDEILFQRYPNLEGRRVFLCGAPAFVNSTRRRAFLAGASLKEIYADAFLTRQPPKVA